MTVFLILYECTWFSSIQQTEDEISEKLDKLPDILKADGYPDVQAFMATYRKMEEVVERYEREVWEYNLKLKQKKSSQATARKTERQRTPPTASGKGRQQSHKEKSFDKDR